MNRTAIISLTLLAVSVRPSSGQASTQDPNPATDEVQNYSLDADSFIDALLKISARFQFPLGVEWVKSADTLKPVQISRNHTTAADMIQAVVSINAQYGWRQENGVIHVFDTALLDDTRNPLNINLKSFGFSDCRPMIAREAEVYLNMRLRDVVAPKIGVGWGASIGSSPDEPKLQLPCNDVSVRYVLNKIIAATKQHIWVAAFPEKITFTPTGFLEEVPMYLPGSDQPFWILLRWGDPPPEKMVK
jgi:hypothetical protein